MAIKVDGVVVGGCAAIWPIAQLTPPSLDVVLPQKSTVSGHEGDYYFGVTDPWVVVKSTTTTTRSTKSAKDTIVDTAKSVVGIK